MTTATTTPRAPLPVGADESGSWIDVTEDPIYGQGFRIAYCHRHDIAGLHLSVEGSAIQLADGTVDGEIEPPCVNIIVSPEMFSTAAARELAAALIAVADQLDGWAGR
jgi:hypothetical protein